jgi:predicted NAD/FAD-binding protein
MKSIAVIGSGVSGLVSAYRLGFEADVELIESDTRFGGHANTVEVKEKSSIKVDTGFIVYNTLTYPGLTKLFKELEVKTVATDMSFGVHDLISGWQYGTSSLKSLFAQPWQLFNPKFLGVWIDFWKFRRHAKEFHAKADKDPKTTVADLIRQAGCGEAFKSRFLYAMAGAIWSTAPQEMDRYPAVSFLDFMFNHRMLDPWGQPVWRTVEGGSISYVSRILEKGKFSRRTGNGAKRISRLAGGVGVEFEDGSSKVYDEVVIATHSDQALALLGNPTPLEKDVLGAIGYQPNKAVLHSDESMMPPNKKAWAAWNVLLHKNQREQVELTYDMNALQHIKEGRWLVTLNPEREIDPDKIHRTYNYNHPFFDVGALDAQMKWNEVSGVDRIHYCGAYWRHGFHEDGLWSAMRVVDQILDTMNVRKIA